MDKDQHGLDTILTFNQVIKAVGLSRATIYRLRNAGTFPPPIHLSIRRIGWLEYEIASWIANLQEDAEKNNEQT